MERKFQCNDCGIVFDADDSVLVNCPACSSDNITPVKPKSKLPKYIGIGFVALALAVGIAVFVKNIKGADIPIIEQDPPIGDPKGGERRDTTETIELGLAPLKTIKPVTADPKTKTYSFTVAPQKTISGQTYKYQLIEFSTGKQVKEQTHGDFSGVAPAPDSEGSYTIRAFAYYKSGKQIEEASMDITGCTKFPEANIQKRTVAQVQADINQMIKAQSAKNITTSGFYAKQVKFTCSDGVTIIGFSDILQQINFGEWLTVNVINVGYDADNRVNAISLNVQ